MNEDKVNTEATKRQNSTSENYKGLKHNTRQLVLLCKEVNNQDPCHSPSEEVNSMDFSWQKLESSWSLD